VPRLCTICTHPARQDIEKSIADGQSNRSIAKQYRVGADAVLRHKRDHFPQLLADSLATPASDAQRDTPANRVTAAVAAHVQRNITEEGEHVVDVFRELFLQLDRLGRLYDAIHEWLADPDDPTKYFIGARSHEINVVYLDYDDCSESGKPSRKRATLQELLDRIERDGHHEPERSESRHADPRELLVKVSAELRQQMQLRVSIVEKLTSAQEIERFKSAVLDAIGEVDSHVRRAVEDNLRRRAPVSGASRPALG
jgi:hypothetical protein